jgi:hypothetical protein
MRSTACDELRGTVLSTCEPALQFWTRRANHPGSGSIDAFAGVADSCASMSRYFRSMIGQS